MTRIALEPHARGTILPVLARAGARRNEIVGTHDGMLRVAVTAAPEKGKANKAIVAVLSEALGVSKSSLEILAGAASSRKRFLVLGVEHADLERTLGRLIDD